MFSQWHRLEFSYGEGLDRLETLASVRYGSPWFDGHFPGQPILPGIALISMAFEVASKHAAQQGGSIRLKTVKRVRFKKPVRPEEPFTVEVKREQKESGLVYNFTIMLAGEACCTGILDVEMIN